MAIYKGTYFGWPPMKLKSRIFWFVIMRSILVTRIWETLITLFVIEMVINQFKKTSSNQGFTLFAITVLLLVRIESRMTIEENQQEESIQVVVHETQSDTEVNNSQQPSDQVKERAIVEAENVFPSEINEISDLDLKLCTAPSQLNLVHHNHNHTIVTLTNTTNTNTSSSSVSDISENVANNIDDVLDCFNENVLPTMVHTENQIHHFQHAHKGDKPPTDENSSTTEKKERPKGFKRRIVNLILFLLGTMCFKFSYETLSGAIGLTILNRLDGNALGATTILSLLTISFGLSQSISSSTVEGLLKVIRATRLYCLSLVFFALLVVVMIILEASTGGTLTVSGWWTPWIIFPIYIFIGFSVGIMEVLRKIVPASILGNNESSVLKRINAGIHITYELAGTAGAFLSSVFIEKMGTIYALFHIPVFFIVAAVFLFFISYKEVEIYEDSQTKEGNASATESANQTADTNPTETQPNKFVRIMKQIGTAIKNYFKSMYFGAKIVVTSRYYIWLIPCFVIPQVLHRLIENIFLPAYSKNILKKGSYSGILLGGSNFGELCGAGMLLIFAKKVKLPTVWIVLDCLFLNLMWIFPFLTFNEKTDDNLIFAICMVPAMMLISGSWAAGDISQVAYLQSTLSEEPNEKTGVNELAAVMSFLYSCYIISTTLIAFGLSQAIDRFKESGQPEFGFMTICIFMSVISLVICVTYLIVAKFKPSMHEQKEALKKPEVTPVVEKSEQVSVI